MGMRLLVLHGPNLNLLGLREGVSGGTLTDLDAALRERADELELELKVVQSNHEGVLLDTLAAEREAVDGIIINPAGLFGSHTLKEALELVGLPAIEVLLKPPARESVVGEACALQVYGTQGFDPYFQALETFSSGIFTTAGTGPKKTLGRGREETPAKPLAKAAEASAPVKTLGRKASAPEKEEARPGKTLGRGSGSKSTPATDLLTRALVRQKISDRLAGKLTPAELATWARTQWEAVQRGAPAESGQRELLEESLQSLTLSSQPRTKLSDEQLVDLLTRLDD